MPYTIYKGESGGTGGTGCAVSLYIGGTGGTGKVV